MFERLSTAIVEGTLQGGEVIRESDVQKWLGVSRTPIREAISRLVTLGLVESAPSRYTRVTSVDNDVVQQTLQFSGYQAGLAVHMAVPLLDEGDGRTATDIVDAMIDANDRGDADELYAASAALVAFMAARTGNEIFARMLRETGFLVARNLRDQRPMIGDTAERRSWYLKLREAIQERDGEYAEYAFRNQHHLAGRTAVEIGAER